MKTLVRQLLARESLSQSQCHALFTSMIHAHVAEQAAILTLFTVKHETAQELLAIRAFLLSHTTFDRDKFVFGLDNIVDITGTGGDGLRTFNISTAASLILSSAGIPVVKHGSTSVTSMTGSADVIQHLRIPPSSTIDEINAALSKHRYAFLKASHFNHLFDKFKTVRTMIGFPTLFNILGPLMNPVSPKRMVLGVYRKELVGVVAEVLRELGMMHALVVHAKNGMDELNVCGETYVAEIKHQEIKIYTISTDAFHFPQYTIDELSVSNSIESANVIQAIFSRQRFGAKRDAVLLNAAAGFLVADVVENLVDGIAMAKDLVDSGKALRFLATLGEASHV